MLLTLLILINLARVNPLVLDTDLSKLAQARAEQLYKAKQWSHTGWQKSFDKTNCKYIGENLAKDFKTAEKAHNSLMASPTHKANIINKKYTLIGLGTYKNITVELFCGQ